MDGGGGGGCAPLGGDCGDEGHPTPTSVARAEVAAEVAACLARAGGGRAPPLARERHVAYLTRSLGGLPASFAGLDASRPWLVYWTLQALDLLGARPPERDARAVVAFLRRCQHPEGGFGGGPRQAPHTASTYAAVLALAVVGTPDALAAVDRAGLLAFVRSVRDAATGGFRVQPDGELDVRGTYTVLAVCHLTGLLDAAPELAAGAADFLLRCQSHEGGFGGEPGNEAHGGYTYCAVAGLALAGALGRCDVRALTRWLVGRQAAVEGGLQGRCNKLVDSCYSFWLGAVFALLPHPPPPPPADGGGAGGAGGAADDGGDDDSGSALRLLDRARLQAYLLACCQAPEGGLRDKPGKPRDLYHTCYALGGLSLAQHTHAGGSRRELVLGDAGNELAATHPLFNLRPERLAAARAFFGGAAAAAGAAAAR